MFARIKISGCNLNCIYCPESNRGGKLKNNFNKIKNFIDALAYNGIDQIKWSGGEATTYPLFIELLQYAKAKGMYQSLTTNATFKPEFMYELKDAGLSRVNISLDTLTKEKYINLCGKDYLDRVLYNIDLASTTFGDITKVNVVVSNYNIDEIESIYNKFKDNKNIIVRFIQLTHKGNDSFTDQNRKDILNIENHFQKGEKIANLDGKLYGNPVAEYYYMNHSKDIFCIIPQDNSCNPKTCIKIWYEDGYAFNCKIGGERFKIEENTSNETIKHLIDTNSIKIKRIHKMSDIQ